MSRILIIGNGFDLGLELKTSYSDFVMSMHFKQLVNDKNSLALHLQKIHGNQNWVDIEHELKNYLTKLEKDIEINVDFIESEKGLELDDVSKNQLKRLRIEFIVLKKNLTDYLIAISNNFKENFNSHMAMNFPAVRVFREGHAGYVNPNVDDSGLYFDETFTFNYTSLFDNFIYEYDQRTCQIHHVHGSLKDRNIVFGVEDGFASASHSYLNKSDHAAFGQAPDVSAAIIAAQEVHFFGCSLGDTDDAHFRRAFKAISTSTAVNQYRRKIYFYIYGNDGYRSIYNRIMALTDNRVSEFKLVNDVTFYDLKKLQIVDQAWLNT